MRIRFMLLFLLLPFNLGAGHEGIAVAIDLCSLDSLAFDTAIIRLEASLEVTPEFSLSMPLTLTAERYRGGVQSWETGLFLQYHPLSWDAFLSLSLMQVALLANHPYEEEPQVQFLNEMAIGWQFQIPPSLIVKPSVVIKDPNRVLTEEYEELQSLFTRFPMVRFALLVGWTFPVPSSKDSGQ